MHNGSQEVIVTNVRLPRPVWELAKMAAVRSRRTLVDVVSCAVEQALRNSATRKSVDLRQAGGKQRP